MECIGREAEIHRYLDGELSVPESERFAAHLAECAACRRDLAQTEALFEVLDRLQAVPAPADLKAGVLAGLPRRTLAPAKRWPITGKLRWVLAAQATLTVALLALIYPRLAGWYAQLSARFAPGWLGDTWAWLASTLTIDLHLPWPTGFGLAWPQAALLAVLLAGLWGLGNRLLLAPEQKQTGGVP